MAVWSAHKSNIAQEHPNNCDKCHEAPTPEVIAAISAVNVTCDCATPRASTQPASSATRPTTTIGRRPLGLGKPVPPLGAVRRQPHQPGRARQLPGHDRQVRNVPLGPPCGRRRHQAAADRDATCAGCHTGGTAVTAKLITWTDYDATWVPEVDPANPLYPVGGAAWMAARTANPGSAVLPSQQGRRRRCR